MSGFYATSAWGRSVMSVRLGNLMDRWVLGHWSLQIQLSLVPPYS